MADDSGNPAHSRAGNSVFQHTDPFQDDRAQHGVADSNADLGSTEQPDDADELRLAGVRSQNPFAETSNSQDHTTSDVSSGEEHIAAERQASTHLSPTTSDTISPGTADTEVVASTDPIDHAYTGSHDPASGSTAGPTTELQALNSNVNQDRGERGTDVYAHVDPLPSTDEKAPSSDSKSDSDREANDRKPGVAFADRDNIGKVETHDDNDEDSDSHGVLEKLKTAAKETFHLQELKATGPIKGFNPTNIHMRMRYGSQDPSDADKEVGIIWRSRDNRKGRNSVVIPRTSMAYPNLPSKNRPVYSSSFKGVGRNLYRMAFSFPYWDMAFWSGWSYTWGSVLFVIDGVWVRYSSHYSKAPFIC